MNDNCYPFPLRFWKAARGELFSLQKGKLCLCVGDEVWNLNLLCLFAGRRENHSGVVLIHFLGKWVASTVRKGAPFFSKKVNYPNKFSAISLPLISARRKKKKKKKEPPVPLPSFLFLFTVHIKRWLLRAIAQPPPSSFFWGVRLGNLGVPGRREGEGPPKPKQPPKKSK